MQSLDERNDSGRASLDAAEAVVRVSWQVVRLVREEVRRHPSVSVSVSQIRALGFLKWNEGASLSEVSGHVGVSAPATSKLVDDLVMRGLVERKVAEADRRRLTLKLTSQGRSLLGDALAGAHELLEALPSPLSGDERATVVRATELLGPLLEPGHKHDDPV